MENDYELIYLYRSRSEEALERLIKKYDKLIWKIIHTFDLKNYESDIDDFYQICLVELFKSLDRYSEERNVSFKTYYYKCARTALLNYLMTENSKSYHQIKSAIALDSAVCEEDGKYLIESFMDVKEEIPKLLELDLEILNRYLTEVCKPIELKIWKLKIMGYSYKEIEQKLQTSNKKIDNTLRKIQKILKRFK